MTAAVCIGLFALGFLVRDGFPATGETQLARGVGAFWCMAGAAAVLPPSLALAAGLAIWLGFYTDQKHAEGQQARDWKDAGYLALSGVTALLPLAFVAAWLFGPPYLTLALVGLAKVPVYFAAWRTVPERGWLQPTRIAAIVFGAVVGAAVAYLGAS